MLSEKWIKASIIGTIWAASEIVFGSFLHNLRIPFSGNILTSIGIIVLISISYIWRDKGLFWRSGLICAILKTMSPSAVIFGPMIAIFSEAILLEISVRLFGKTLAGYMLGAMLAMSWNLVQKLVNLVIFYGFNIVELYEKLIKIAQKQLDINVDIIWMPIIFLLLIYCLLGIISAIIGIRVGRKLQNQPANFNFENTPHNFSEKQNKKSIKFNYSSFWLLANLGLIVFALFVLNYTNWEIWTVTITIIVWVWALRYKRALRQLSKPKFWIFFVVITMITTMAFSKIQGSETSIENGLLIGLQMNFRAVIIILGFSVLGTELYNPKIRNYFQKTYFKQLPLALEISFESLPLMIANIPDFRTILKNPVSIIYQIISQAELRLIELKKSMNMNQNVFIITGTVGQGKTTNIEKIASVLKKNEIPVGGFYSPRIMKNDKTIGYDIVNISNNQRTVFLRQANGEACERIGKFKIFDEGLKKGMEILNDTENCKNKIVVIDEVGALELANRGWAGSIEHLTKQSEIDLIIAVRNSFIEKVIRKWNFNHYFIYDTNEKDAAKISDSIIKHIER